MAELDAYEAVLRLKPNRTWVVLCVWAACACVAWLGWCAVSVVHEYALSQAAKACGEAGNAWTGTGCAVPEVHITLTPKTSAKPESPLLGPGGA